MGVTTIGASARETGRSAGKEKAPSPVLCALGAVARVLSSLLQREVSEDEVRDRAVGLGLLRQPGSEEGAGLTAQAVSRLLLAGYHLPAQVEPADLAALAGHLHTRRLVFLFADGLQLAPRPAAFQVHGCNGTGAGDGWLLLTEASASARGVQSVPLDDHFAESWAAAGNLLLVAAPAWSDLPREGIVFFGGICDPDGVYHWNSAECDTDGTGRILRY
jgi:hypothetical protein